MHNFKELKIWQKRRVFAKDIFLLTKSFPKEELFVLASQMKRAAISITSNIAEGAGRGSSKDFSRFIDIATGSAYELESLIYTGFDMNYYKEEEMVKNIDKIQEIQKMLFSFKNYLNS